MSSSILHSMNYRDRCEYTANFYKGCGHGCVYCYAPSLVHDERSWGTFVDAKVNAPKILEKEIGQFKRGVVFLSSASDPYQPIEAKYRLTRKCLEILLRHQFPVLILTRSPLVLRDLDLFKKFDWIRVGFSMTSVSNKKFEPGVPSLDKRLEGLRRLSEGGIATWVSLAPIIPQLLLTDLNLLLRKIKEAGVSVVIPGLSRFNGYEESRVMFEESTGMSASQATMQGAEVRQKVIEMARDNGLDTFDHLLSWREQENTLDKFV